MRDGDVLRRDYESASNRPGRNRTRFSALPRTTSQLSLPPPVGRLTLGRRGRARGALGYSRLHPGTWCPELSVRTVDPRHSRGPWSATAVTGAIEYALANRNGSGTRLGVRVLDCQTVKRSAVTGGLTRRSHLGARGLGRRLPHRACPAAGPRYCHLRRPCRAVKK